MNRRILALTCLLLSYSIPHWKDQCEFKLQVQSDKMSLRPAGSQLRLSTDNAVPWVCFCFLFFSSFTDSTRILRICRMSKLAPLILPIQGKWCFCSSPSSSTWISHRPTKAADFHLSRVPKTGLGGIKDRRGEFNALSIDAMPLIPPYLQRHHVTQLPLRGLSALKLYEQF